MILHYHRSDNIYDNSILSNRKNLDKFLAKPTVKAIEKDPATAYSRSKNEKLQEFIQVLAVGEDGVVVNVVYVCVVVALELSVDGLVEGGQLVGVQCLGKGGQDGFGYGAVHFVVVVFIVDTIVCIFQLLLRSLQQ